MADDYGDLVAMEGARFLLVADGWGGDASAVLELSQGDVDLNMRRMLVDARAKSVELHQFRVEIPQGALPQSAKLVAAKVVEDQELAVRFILLVFLDRSGSSGTQQSGGRKRRRSSSDGSHVSLWFARLACVDKQSLTAQLRVLNSIELPPTMLETASVDTSGAGEVQVQLTDGPFVMVFTPRSQRVLVMTMIQEGDAAEFLFWRDPVDVQQHGDAAPVRRIVSCEHINGDLAPHSHLLMHTISEPTRGSSSQGGCHRWLVYPTDERLPESSLKPYPSVYIPDFSTSFAFVDEQVVCASIMNDIGGSGSVSSLSDWIQTLAEFQTPERFATEQRIDLSISSLLIMGTTRNSIFVFTNGLLVASMVLPATPISIHVVGQDIDARRCVITVQCSNLNHSCFLLAFDPRSPNESITILQGFKHVGHALIGEFSALEGSPSVLSAQTLLLNHVPTNTADFGIDDLAASCQLAKRSVLLHQPSAKAKTVCVRLRLREAKKDRGAKRQRDSKSAAYTSFKYIERTHKGAVHADINDDESREEGAISTSNSHLAALIKSLDNRVTNGLLEFDRLKIITREKKALLNQLNRLVMVEWWASNGNRNAADGSLLACGPAKHITNGIQAQNATSMLDGLEDVIDCSKHTDDNPIEKENNFVQGKNIPVLTSSIRMKQFRVVKYISQTSTVRVEVSIVNGSTKALVNAFASVTLSPVARESGEVSNCGDFTTQSSVVPAFYPQGKDSDGMAVFHLDIVLEQPPLQLLQGLRARLAGKLWLHWKATCTPNSVPDGGRLDDMRIADRSLQSFSIAPVGITAADLMAQDDSSLDSQSPDNIDRGEAELLLVSAGSNLPMWFQRLKILNGPTASRFTPRLVRPMFALATWPGRDEQQSAFLMGQLMNELPRDVYAIRNPLQATHIMVLLRCLIGLRREILSMQRRSIVPRDEDPTDSEEMENDEGSINAVFAFVRSHRLLQRETDLRVVALMHELSQRADFHQTWFGQAHIAK